VRREALSRAGLPCGPSLAWLPCGLSLPAPGEVIADARGHPARLGLELAPGETEHRVPERLQLDRPAPVGFERGPGPVKGPAVELDDQASVAPEEVDLVPGVGEPDVDLGAGQTGGGQDVQAPALEL